MNLDNFLCVHPQRPMVLRDALPNFGLDNLLNRVISPSKQTVIGLRDLFLRVLARKQT